LPQDNNPPGADDRSEGKREKPAAPNGVLQTNTLRGATHFDVQTIAQVLGIRLAFCEVPQ
jgi:hypothetical protein